MHYIRSFFRNGARPSSLLLPAVTAFTLFFAAPDLMLAQGQSADIVHIDASQPWRNPDAALYDLNSGQSPDGSTLGLNSRYLTRDGKPFLPVMGEFHFSRYPRAQWEEELLKMKASGVNIVATYVIWIHHEEIEGHFDWSGQRDLRAFAQLCAKHGLLLEPRIGPWAHAEVRNGGLPDWVVKNGHTRSNDPVYLAAVNRFYGEIGRQLKGLMWKDGGPVMAIQLENEYSARGPGAGEEHILALKKMAIANGMEVPYYFVTGWDNAVVPERAVIPVYGGGYPDAPWNDSIAKLPPPEVYAFRFHSRVTANKGATDTTAEQDPRPPAQEGLPYLTAEIGGGIEDTYHRRPVIQPDDIAAMFPVMLGSGVNLYGTYMFQGGENPDGKLTTLQESQATGYPNDLPIKSYDFQAPIGEFGQERAVLGKMKVYQYFLNSFGVDLAPMMVHAPAVQPASPADFSVVRAAVRTQGNAGFLFCNNYVRNYPMPARDRMQFEVQLPGETLRIPARPIAIPSGAYFIWPIHQRIGSVDLIYATAQPFTKIESGASTVYYYAAVRGMTTEFAIANGNLKLIKASSGKVHRDGNVTYVSGIEPGVDAWIDLAAKNGQHTRLVILSADEAENAWKVRIGGAERLIITAQNVVPGADGAIRLRSLGDAHFAFTLTPATAQIPQASLRLTQSAATTQSAAAEQSVSYTATAQERRLDADVQSIKAAGVAPAVKLAPPPSWRATGVAQAPAEGELPAAAQWSIAIPKGALDGLNDASLQIRYQGDVARLNAGDRLLTDDFFNGLDWDIGLKRFLDNKSASTFRLSILPLRKDAPVYFELQRPMDFGARRSGDPIGERQVGSGV